MNSESAWVEAVVRSFHATPMHALTALMFLKDWVSQQIDMELDEMNEDSDE